MQTNIVHYSSTKKDSGLFRLDAEHYQKHYIENQNMLNKFGAVPLKALLAQPVLTGHTPSMKIDAYYGGHIKFIKTNNLRDFKVTGIFNHHLSTLGNDIIRRSSLKKDDLITTIIGATHEIVGRTALIREEDLPANINQNIALIRLKKSFSPEFLSTYLNSKVGRLALWHLSRQTEQVNLNCREVESVLVPTCSKKLVRIIKTIYAAAVETENESKKAFKNAELTLLKEIGLSNWNPQHILTFVNNYNETISANRIDAEHYQPKYGEIVTIIKNYKHGWDILGNMVDLKDDNYIPDSNKFYKYIELANITDNSGITEPMYKEGQMLPSRARRIVNVGDVIVSSLEGSLTKIALIDIEHSQALCSTGFHVVSPHSIKPEVILVFLKSIAGQMQLKHRCRGTILPAINKTDFLNIKAPIFENEIQDAIARKVTSTANLRMKSRRLLKNAKKAVEIAVTHGEQEALGWLKTQAGDLDAPGL